MKSEHEEAERRSVVERVRKSFSSLVMYPLYDEADAADAGCSIVWQEGLSKQLLVTELKPDVAPYGFVMATNTLCDLLATLEGLLEDDPAEADECERMGKAHVWLSNAGRPIVMLQLEPPALAGQGVANIETEVLAALSPRGAT